MTEVLINDVDLFDYAWTIGQVGDISTTGKTSALANSQSSSPAMSDALVTLLGQLGQTWGGEPVQAAARSLTFGGFILGTSQADYLAKVDAMKALLSNGAVRVRFADRPTQEFRDARLLQFAANPRAAFLSNLAGDVSFSLQFADPLRYDVTAQIVQLGVNRQPLPVGTAPSFPLLWISSEGSTGTETITINLRNAAGDIVQTMALTYAPSSGDYIIIDCSRIRIRKALAGGAEADGLSLWSSGDFLVIRPGDASFDISKYATIDMSVSGAVPFSGFITYCRAWL